MIIGIGAAGLFLGIVAILRFSIWAESWLGPIRVPDVAIVEAVEHAGDATGPNIAA